MNAANGLENLYVRFRSNDMDFLLSACYIETMLAKNCDEIKEADVGADRISYDGREMPLYFFNKLLGAPISYLEKYLIIIDAEKGNFVICVDEITDVIMWDEMKLFSIPSYIKNERNLYLDSAGIMPDCRLAYIIDPEKIGDEVLLADGY